MCDFKVSGKSIPYLFSGRNNKSFYFYALNGVEKTSDGTLYFDLAMEKDIVYTLWYFDNMREFSDIRAVYKIHNGKIQLRIFKEDLDYMITSVVLNKSKLCQSLKRNRKVIIETDIPFLLHGLIFGQNEQFSLCYDAFVKLFWVDYFSKFSTKKTLRKALHSVFNNTFIKKNFHDLLLFLGRCLESTKITPQDFRYRDNNKLLRSIRSYCYVINRSMERKAKHGISHDSPTLINLSGSSQYNYIYTNVNVTMDKLKDEKKCSLEKILRIYKLCFTNLDLPAFENTFIQLQKRKIRKELVVSNVENSFNFANPLPDQFSSHESRNVFIKLQYEKIERYYRELLYDSRPVSDTKTETLMLKPLLLILDALKFTDSKNCSMYVHKTRLFDILLKLIKRQSYKTVPLLVPTLPKSEDVNGIASTDLYDYFSTAKWVFPIFLAEKEYDMSTVEKLIKTNKHKLS